MSDSPISQFPRPEGVPIGRIYELGETQAASAILPRTLGHGRGEDHPRIPA